VYDGWILDPITMVDMIAEDFLEPLDAYIQADPSIEWTSDVNRWGFVKGFVGLYTLRQSYKYYQVSHWCNRPSIQWTSDANRCALTQPCMPPSSCMPPT
jgi:hypothetical protein